MELLIVSGLSGAGKSVAMNALEDIGFFCIDNVPAGLLPSITAFSKAGDNQLERVALSMDVRGCRSREQIETALQQLDEQKTPYKILFLDAPDDVLMRRYSETRRRHPISIAEGISTRDAFLKERQILQPLKERANYTINTGLLSTSQNKERICDLFMKNGGAKNAMRLTIMSFGFKFGLPPEADLVLDVLLTLPMVLPPTVVGYFLLLLFGAKRPLGIFFMQHFGVKLVMNWYSAIFASIVVAFPLMYRTARGAFESFDETLAWSAQTLGQSDTWIFWRVRMPACRQGILAGTVLAFARALGEYGATSMIAGYTPGKTATIATTVYQLWRTNDELGAMRWVLVDIAISAVVLLAVNLLEKKQKAGARK